MERPRLTEKEIMDQARLEYSRGVMQSVYVKGIKWAIKKLTARMCPECAAKMKETK